ncbi:hypothetical protein AOLI_G00100960 [Acnodon oligacanthus]
MEMTPMGKVASSCCCWKAQVCAQSSKAQVVVTFSISPDTEALLRVSDSTECTKFPERLWPNTDQTECIPMLVEFLSFQDNMGIILFVLSVVGAALTGTGPC